MTKKLFTLLMLGLLAGGLSAAQTIPGIDSATTNAVRLFQVPGGGVDNLHFTVWDTIEVPGVGTDTVELRGSYTIRRHEPTTRQWQTAEMDIEMVQMNVAGTSGVLGNVQVSLNGTNVGHVFATETPTSEKDCQVAGSVQIHLQDLGLTVFNKERVPLSHGITHIPPIGQGGSSPEVRIALYDVNHPDGAPVAFLRKVRTQIGGYIH